MIDAVKHDDRQNKKQRANRTKINDYKGEGNNHHIMSFVCTAYEKELQLGLYRPYIRSVHPSIHRSIDRSILSFDHKRIPHVYALKISECVHLNCLENQVETTIE